MAEGGALKTGIGVWMTELTSPEKQALASHSEYGRMEQFKRLGAEGAAGAFSASRMGVASRSAALQYTSAAGKENSAQQRESARPVATNTAGQARAQEEARERAKRTRKERQEQEVLSQERAKFARVQEEAAAREARAKRAEGRERKSSRAPVATPGGVVASLRTPTTTARPAGDRDKSPARAGDRSKSPADEADVGRCNLDRAKLAGSLTAIGRAVSRRRRRRRRRRSCTYDQAIKNVQTWAN